MKKFFLLVATAALTLTSCSNDEVLSSPEKENTGESIEFRPTMDNKSSSLLRSAITDGDNILSFTVTGMKQSDGGYLFNGFGITRGEDSSNEWDYTPKRYWPVGDAVDFYAYSPSSSRNVTAGITDYTTSKSIAYTVPQISKRDAQEDFLVARVTNHNESKGPVKLNFHHTLSRVMFFARTTQKNITYTIDSIELVNLHEKGTLNLSNSLITESASLNYSSPVLPWVVNTSTKVNYTVDMGESPIYLLNEYASVLGKTNAILVLPQQTTLGTTADGSDGNFYVKVAYKAFVDDIYYAGSKTQNAVKYFPVKGADGNAIAFEMGRQYNFFLEFGDEVGAPIQFQVGVSNWSNTPNTFLPEIADYSGLISADLKGLLSLPTSGTITKAQIEAAPTTITLTSSTVPDLTGLEYLPIQEFIVNITGTYPLLDVSKCSVLSRIEIENGGVQRIIAPNNIKSIITSGGDYGTAEYTDGTIFKTGGL